MGSLSETRILAIDLGARRIGLAVSDPTRTFAVGLETLIVTMKTDPVAELVTICQDYDVERIILGLPRKMDGTEGIQAEKVREFAEALTAATGLPLEFLDERLTSVLAQQTLRAQGIQPSRHKELVDQAAAKRILQDYLDRLAFQRQRASDPEA
jgi:putative Holliday junction resolvase